MFNGRDAIARLTVMKIFQDVFRKRAEGVTCDVHCWTLEYYLGELKDLLNDGERVTREKRHPVATPDNALLALFIQACKIRQGQPTQKNTTGSSRGHFIFPLQATMNNEGVGGATKTLYMADLAGSEKVDPTHRQADLSCTRRDKIIATRRADCHAALVAGLQSEEFVAYWLIPLIPVDSTNLT